MRIIIFAFGILIITFSNCAMQKGFLVKSGKHKQNRDSLLNQLTEITEKPGATQNEPKGNSRDYESSSIAVAEMILHMLKEGKLKPEPVAGIPEWPGGVGHKCRTVTLSEGPDKGNKARIVSSLWAWKGIDTIKSCSSVNHIFGEAFYPLWKFYLEVDVMSPDGCTPLYYGKIVYKEGDGGGCIIPESWLSAQDRINLYNFHRYELEILGKQLFDSTSKSRPILLAKINNELERGHTHIMSNFLTKVRGELNSMPLDERFKAIKEWTDLSKTLSDYNEKDYPDHIEIKSAFLHAVFLEALKHYDFEITCNRKILYNSLAILQENTLKDASKRKEDREPREILACIDKLLPLAEVMRSFKQVDRRMYTDLLPHDVRLKVVGYSYPYHDRSRLSASSTQEAL